MQPQNLQRSKAYKANKLDEALVASYLRIDDIMRTQSHLLDLEKQKGEHNNDNLIGAHCHSRHSATLPSV